MPFPFAPLPFFRIGKMKSVSVAALAGALFASSALADVPPIEIKVCKALPQCAQ